MKDKKTKEEILARWEAESCDRLLDRTDYNERVIFPAMEQYAYQFINPIIADNIFELIGQGIYKINCCELTVGGLADEVEKFVSAAFEERLREELIAFGKVVRSWGIVIPSDILECSIDEYLKTRESNNQ
jgi:hypothetical protein